MAKDTDSETPQEDIDKLKSADAKDLHQAVSEEGEEELDRPFVSLLFSGLAGGMAITSSLITEGALHHALPDAPWRELIVKLGYPVGFLVVILGRMQLFTESTITAVLPLVGKPSWWALRRTLRLWAIVLLANLAGTAITGGAIAAGVLGSEELRAAMIAVSMDITQLSPWTTFVNAIPAGFMIAILAWSLPNAREQAFLVIFAIAYFVAIGDFSHSIVGSDKAFLLMFAGHTGVWQTFGELLVPAILGNLLGGAGLFALLAHAQVRAEIHQQRADNGQDQKGREGDRKGRSQDDAQGRETS